MAALAWRRWRSMKPDRQPTRVLRSAGVHYISALYPGSSSLGPSASSVSAENIPIDIQDFSIVLSPTSVVLTGASASAQADVIPINGFSGDVSLSCSTGGPDLSCTLLPSDVPGGTGSSTLPIVMAQPRGKLSSVHAHSFLRLSVWLAARFCASQSRAGAIGFRALWDC
jgi:hypothetical protein